MLNDMMMVLFLVLAMMKSVAARELAQSSLLAFSIVFAEIDIRGQVLGIAHVEELTMEFAAWHLVVASLALEVTK